MKFSHVLAMLTLSLASQSSIATVVSSGGNYANGHLTDLGYFAAGSYQITGSGVVDLTGLGNFQMLPDGTPSIPVTAPGYSYFNPTGSYIADGVYGAAGTNAKIGALIGTLSATPNQASDWFLIGYSKTIHLSTAGHIYASVNDTYHNNNTGFFNADVAAIPEPETYAMMIAGLGLLGFAARRKQVAK